MRLHFAESRGADFLQLRLSLFPNSEAIIIEILDKTSDALSQIRLAMRLVHQTDADELLALRLMAAPWIARRRAEPDRVARGHSAGTIPQRPAEANDPRAPPPAGTVSRLRRLALVLSAILGSLIVLAAAGAGTSPGRTQALAEVVVTLPRQPLAEAIQRDRQLARAATTKHRLNIRAPASVTYLRSLAVAQRALQTRIETAKRQLASDDSIKAIAFGLGFASPSSFSYAFRRATGSTPRQFRQRQLRKAG